MPLVPGNEPPKLEEPGEEAFHLPSASISPERTAILCLSSPGRPMRCNHLNAVLSEILVEWVAVVGSVADQAFREFPGESLAERGFDESRFMSLTTSKPDGDRKARAVCHCHDLGRFAAASSSNKSSPFFAPAWEPSMYASLRSSRPRSLRSSANARRILRRIPLRTQPWNRRWHV